MYLVESNMVRRVCLQRANPSPVCVKAQTITFPSITANGPFRCRSLRVGIVVGEVALEEVLLPVLQLSPVSINAQAPHTHIPFIQHQQHVSLTTDIVIISDLM